MVVVNTKERRVTVKITRGPKGAPFTYEDFTPEQLEGLKLKFADLTEADKEELKLKFSDLTPEEKEELSLKWDQLTEQQKAELKGDKGEPFTYEDFTAAQLAALKGDKGDPFTYEDFTQAQKDEIFNTFLSNFYDPSIVALSSRGNLEGATFEVKLNKIQEQMNILDPKPSLLMLPSGVKAGKLYSILPEDGSGDFTVERNSTATRVNADGLIEVVAPNVPRIDFSTGEPMLLVEGEGRNLIINSENFETSSWVNALGSGGGPSVRKNIPSHVHFGNLCEVEVVGAQGGVRTVMGGLPNNTNHVMAVYVENVDIDKIQFRCENAYAYSGASRYSSIDVDVRTGSIINISTAPPHTVKPFGRGYLLSINLGLSSAEGSVRVNYEIVAHSDNTASGKKFIMGLPQVEPSSIASSYIPTNGMIATRLADNIFQVFPKTGDAIITFADGAVQTISGNEGDTFTLPQGLIKRVEML